MIADNPMVTADVGGADLVGTIIATRPNQAILPVLEGHCIVEGYPHRQFEFAGEQYTIVAYHLMTREFDTEQHPIIIEKLFNRAIDWYIAYCAWEDAQQL